MCIPNYFKNNKFPGIYQEYIIIEICFCLSLNCLVDAPSGDGCMLTRDCRRDGGEGGRLLPMVTSALIWQNSADNTATFSNKQLYVKSIYTF